MGRKEHFFRVDMGLGEFIDKSVENKIGKKDTSISNVHIYKNIFTKQDDKNKDPKNSK